MAKKAKVVEEEVLTQVDEIEDTGDGAQEDTDAVPNKVLDNAFGVEDLPGAATSHNSSEEVINSLKAVIRIHNQGGDTGDKPVFVAVNGMGYSIPREKKVKVPMPILHALEDAVETRYIKNPVTKENEERYVPRFAYTVFETNVK